MERRENTTVEFKREFTPAINKTIIAFANTQGGTIYVGMADDGSVIGVESIDAVCQQIINIARDTVDPDIMMFLDCHSEEIEGKTIIEVVVRRGSSQPYYLKDKGPVPAGVYVRQGTSSVQASRPAIKRMIKETDGDIYEEGLSREQNLTFQEAAKIFAAKAVPFGENHKVSLGIKNRDGAYTNVALLLSDQNPHPVKVAVFEGVNKEKFRDRKEFSGSLLKQLEDVEFFINMFNRVPAEIVGLYRIDSPDYNSLVIREVLLNALGHRDYSLAGNIHVNIYDDRLEVVSLGGLFGGIQREDILQGVSSHRNSKLANILYRLEFIEAYGTGIPKIMESYKNFRTLPEIRVTANVFAITLPNRNFAAAKVTTIKGVGKTQSKASLEAERIILAMFETREHITREEVEKALSISNTMAKRRLRELIASEKITQEGYALKTRYKLNKKTGKERPGN